MRTAGCPRLLRVENATMHLHVSMVLDFPPISFAVSLVGRLVIVCHERFHKSLKSFATLPCEKFGVFDSEASTASGFYCATNKPAIGLENTGVFCLAVLCLSVGLSPPCFS